MELSSEHRHTSAPIPPIHVTAAFAPAVLPLHEYAYCTRVEPGGALEVEWISRDFVRRYTETPGVAESLPLVVPEDRPMLAERIVRLLRGESDTAVIRIATPTGATRWLRDTARPEWDETHTRVVRIRGVGRDITEMVRGDAAMHSVALFRVLPQPALLYREATHAIVDANDAATTLYGLTREELCTHALADLATIIPGDAPSHLPVRHRRGDGTTFAVTVASAPIVLGEDCLCVALLTPIAEKEANAHALCHDPLHDPLTGLANRPLFRDRLEWCMARAARYGEARYAVLLLGVDDFSTLNTEVGRDRGDQVLVAIARAVSRFLRPDDTVARFEADVFAVLLDGNTDMRSTVAVAERIGRELFTLALVDGTTLSVGISIGVAPGRSRHRVPEDVLHDADRALHLAKREGKGRIVQWK